jgi:hypothetical protein
VRRRQPPAPPEMPAPLRSFDPAEWQQVSDGGDERAARARFDDAVKGWCRENGVSPLEVLQERVRMRRLMAGWVDGQPPAAAGGRDWSNED